MKTISGICRVCGCSESAPCVLPSEFDDDPERPLTCAWIDPARTLCSNPRCMAVIPLEELLEIAGLDELDGFDLNAIRTGVCDEAMR